MSRPGPAWAGALQVAEHLAEVGAHVVGLGRSEVPLRALAARTVGKLSPSRAEELFFGYLEEVRALCGLADGYGAPPRP